MSGGSPVCFAPPGLDGLPSRMMAALFYQPNDVRYEETALPALQPGDMLVRVETALTCGTDVKCYRRGHPVLLKHFPSPFGHEFAGTVVSTTDGVRFRAGDRVVVANSAPCYQCFFCNRGQTNLCEHLDLLNGAYAEYIRVPARIARHNAYLLPEGLPFEIAAFCEPLAVCLYGLDQSPLQPGDRVAVMGLGPIGQLMVRLARLKGAHVTALARNPDKLALAQRFGLANEMINLTQASPAEIRQATPDGRGFDLVIEAIGRPETWTTAIDLVRKGGTVNLFGGCPAGSTLTLDTRRLHYDEVRLVSPFHHTPRHFRQALELLSAGHLDPRPLLTDTMPMSCFETALQRVEAGEAMKIALQNQ